MRPALPAGLALVALLAAAPAAPAAASPGQPPADAGTAPAAPATTAAETPASAVTIVPPEKEVPFGLVRVEADVKPPCVRVEFFLDGKKVLARNRAPYTVEIDLGNVLARHVLKVVGTDAAGQPAGTDERVLNGDAVLPSAVGTTVAIQLSAVDEKGEAVEGLRPEEIEILDGTSRPVVSVEPAAGLPLALGVVLDVSSAMKDALAPVREAFASFLVSMVREKDQGFVVQFRDAATVSARLSPSVSAMITALGESRAMGGSALRDGIVLALYQFHGGRRAMVLVTEGTDSNSRADVETLIGYVRRAGVPIYPIAVNAGILEFGPKSRLKDLAAATGGEAFAVGGKGLKELPKVLSAIEADLRAQYVVRFQPEAGAPSTAVRPITVRVKRPGVRVRTLAAYAP